MVKIELVGERSAGREREGMSTAQLLHSFRWGLFISAKAGKNLDAVQFP